MSIFPHVILLSASWDQSRIWGVHLCHKDPKSIKKWLSYDYFSIERLCYFIEIQMGPKEILGCSFMPQRFEISQEMAKLQLFSYWEVTWFYWEPHETKGDPWVFICAKNIQSWSQNGWVMAIFPLGGCVISLRTIWDQRGSLGAHLFKKDPKSIKKWLWYGYFPTGRLCDFIENHMGPQGILGCSIVPKRFKIGQEMAELWLFFHWEVAWFHWEPHGTKGDPRVFICAKKIQNRSRNGWVTAIFPLRGCVIS